MNILISSVAYTEQDHFFQHLVRDCPRNRKNNEDRKKRDQKDQAQQQDLQRKESTSKETFEHQIGKEEYKQSPKVEKILDRKETGNSMGSRYKIDPMEFIESFEV